MTKSASLSRTFTNSAKPPRDPTTPNCGHVMSFENIPQEMRAYPQWVVWRYEQRDGSDKPTKNLYSPQYGYQASVNAP